MMEAAGGSGGGSQSGSAERSGGDQSEGNFAKHCLISNNLARSRCFVPAHLSKQRSRAFNAQPRIRVSGVFRGAGMMT
jgi:hypothetical protein